MRCRSYIDGQWQETSSAPVVALSNPADRREIVSLTVTATAADAVRAIEAAAAAFPDWGQFDLATRVAVVERLLSEILENSDELACAIVAETGKTLAEAHREVVATVDESRVQIDLFQRSEEGPDGHAIVHEPLGVVLLVTPSNFPLAGVMRKLVPALLAGNVAVVKASELTPMTSVLLFTALDTAGLAPGVASLVIADGQTVVPPMLAMPELKAISLTGSSATGQAIAEAISDRNIRFQAEMGGSNAVVILADADLEMAATGIAEHGFAYCGQWCTGTSRVIVDQSVYQQFLEILQEKIERIVTGAGSEPTTTMGPLISSLQQRRVSEAVNALLEEGARVLTGGAVPDDDELVHGNYFEPTLLADIGDYESLCNTEIFGPVVAVVAASGIDDALAKANTGRYGLSFSIYTRDLELARQFVAAVDAGICHVNMPTGYRHNALPVSGRKESGRGIPECGTYARDFFSQPKAVYGLHKSREQQ